MSVLEIRIRVRHTIAVVLSIVVVRIIKSSTWWSIRVSESQLSIELSETANARGPSLEEFPAEMEVVAIVVDSELGTVGTGGRLTAGISVATVGRLTTGRRDATVGRLISATSLVATVVRLTTRFGREDDAPPVPSAA